MRGVYGDGGKGGKGASATHGKGGGGGDGTSCIGCEAVKMASRGGGARLTAVRKTAKIRFGRCAAV